MNVFRYFGRDDAQGRGLAIGTLTDPGSAASRLSGMTVLLAASRLSGMMVLLTVSRLFVVTMLLVASRFSGAAASNLACANLRSVGNASLLACRKARLRFNQ